KKRPGRSGVGGNKADFSPPNATRRREIVEEIVDHLWPWKRRLSEAAVTADVSRELGSLLPFAFSTREGERSHRKACRTHAKQLDKALTEVEALLAWVPNHWAWLSYSVMPSDGICGGHRSFWDPERANQKRVFVTELNRLHSVCAQVLNPSWDRHPNFDVRKYFCATSAHNLTRAMSKKKITSSEDGAFRAIASLLYEAVSGREADLKRACASVLKQSPRVPN